MTKVIVKFLFFLLFHKTCGAPGGRVRALPRPSPVGREMAAGKEPAGRVRVKDVAAVAFTYDFNFCCNSAIAAILVDSQ